MASLAVSRWRRTWRLWAIAVVMVITTSIASADNGDIGSPANETSSAVGTPGRKILSRHRRYLVFPEGSTFTSAVCLTVDTYLIRAMNIYTLGLAWGIAYDLPNNTAVLASAGAGIEPTDLLRRGRADRKDLYRRFERAADSAGLDGRACVLRAVCESNELPRFGENGNGPRSLSLELLRTILNVPVDSLSPKEPVEHHEYASARQLGVDGVDCARHFPTCPTSFVSLVASLTPTSII